MDIDNIEPKIYWHDTYKWVCEYKNIVARGCASPEEARQEALDADARYNEPGREITVEFDIANPDIKYKATPYWIRCWCCGAWCDVPMKQITECPDCC